MSEDIDIVSSHRRSLFCACTKCSWRWWRLHSSSIQFGWLQFNVHCRLTMKHKRNFNVTFSFHFITWFRGVGELFEFEFFFIGKISKENFHRRHERIFRRHQIQTDGRVIEESTIAKIQTYKIWTDAWRSAGNGSVRKWKWIRVNYANFLWLNFKWKTNIQQQSWRFPPSKNWKTTQNTKHVDTR